MFRLSFFLTALWLSTAAAQLGNSDDVSNLGSDVCQPFQELGGKYYEDTGKEPDLSKLTFTYTYKNQTSTYNLTEAATEIPKEPWFNQSLPFIIYCHGFLSSPSGSGYQTVKSAFEDRGGFVIGALDASSEFVVYIRSVIVIKYIGEKLGELIVALIQAGLKHSNLHLVGHSLGAHVVGFAGKTVLNRTGSRVNRASGLDPAGPCFEKLNSTMRLDKSDAEFVDIIHTNLGFFGITQQIGHVDYYPNGGTLQKSCYILSCSHSRAWMYFAESVTNSQAFLGVKCNSWEDFRNRRCDYNDTSLMGYPSSPVSKDKYYLETSGGKPYGLGARGV